jgi:hypothetical protein
MELMVKLVVATFAVALVAPVLLLVAVALGPVILGLICALGFGLIVFVLWSLAVGLGLFGRSLERAGMRHMRHAQGPHHSR